MNTLVNLVRVGFYVTVTICVAYLSILSGRAIKSTGGVAEAVKSAMSDVGGAARGWRSVATKADTTIDAQQIAISNTIKETSKSARQFRTLLDYTNRSLNEPQRGLLPSLSSLSGAIQADASRSFDRIDHAVLSLDTTVQSIQSRISSPEITNLVTNSEQASINLNRITESSAVTSANFAAMTGDMRIKVHSLTQPPSRLHTILDGTYTTLKFGSLFIP